VKRSPAAPSPLKPASMSIGPDPLPPGPIPSSTAHSLSWAGMVLIALFLTTVAGTLWPLRLLDPTWQLRVGGGLINTSPLALTGLALLHLAAAQDPLAPWLRRRRRIASHLAVAVSVGFVLLVPLLSTAVLRQQAEQSRSGMELGQRTAQLQVLRQAVVAASSPQELRARLAALKAPLLDDTALSLPLPQLKQQLLARLDQAAARLARARSVTLPTQRWALLGEMLRTALACLALGVGFASLGKRRRGEVSLLLELQFAWEALRHGRRRWQASGQRNRPMQDLVELLAEPEHKGNEDA